MTDQFSLVRSDGQLTIDFGASLGFGISDGATTTHSCPCADK